MKKNKFNVKKFVKLHTKLNSIAAAGIIDVLSDDPAMDKVYKYLLMDCNAAMRWIVEDTFFVEGQIQEEKEKETR
jgi:hypothetical protein